MNCLNYITLHYITLHTSIATCGQSLSLMQFAVLPLWAKKEHLSKFLENGEAYRPHFGID